MGNNNTLIPGPGIWSFHKNVLRNPALYFHSLMKEYGDIVRCRSINDIYLISHPEYARAIFQLHAKKLAKNDNVNARLKNVIGEGVVVSSGDRWRDQRYRAQVVFQKKEINQFIPIVARHAETLAVKWSHKKDAVVNLQEEISQHLLGVLLKCLFNEDDPLLKSELNEAFVSGYEFVGKASFINLPPRMPFTKNNRLIRSARKMDSVIISMQNENKLTHRYKGSLLDHLMKFKSEDGSSLTSSEVTAEVKNILSAGHFSTTDLLCWMIHSMALYPEWQNKIREELNSNNDLTDFHGISSMQYFIHEVMRCYPPVWSSWHRSLEDIQIDKFTIPRDKTIIISFFNLHRNPSCWNQPDDFNPLRFANGSARPDIFMPFGFGQRKCLGMGLANIIINQTIAHLALNLDLKIDPFQSAPEIQSRVTLGSKDPLCIRVSSLK